MDIWHSADAPADAALARLVARAQAAGCAVSLRGHPDGSEPTTPLLVWQEVDDPLLRAAAMDSGADDVLGPWMHDEEALARLLRLHHRLSGDSAHRLVLGELDIDMIDRDARRAERPLRLLQREYELLLHLARHCGRIQSREALLRAVWRFAFDPGTNVVEVHVSRLRAKLDRGFSWPMLHTVRGSGYCLMAQG